MNTCLWNRGFNTLAVYLDQKLRTALKEIEHLSASEANDPFLAARLTRAGAINLVTVHWARERRTPITLTEVEIEIDNSSLSRVETMESISLTIPFTGDPELLRRDATEQAVFLFPNAHVRELTARPGRCQPGEITLTVKAKKLTVAHINSSRAEFIAEVTKRLTWAENDIAEWTAAYAAATTQALAQRIQRLIEIVDIEAELDASFAASPEPERASLSADTFFAGMKI